MWAWYKGEYLLPTFDRWPYGEAILPVDQLNDFLLKVIRTNPSKQSCHRFKVLTEEGLSELCLYCKNAALKFVDDKLVCTFSFNKDGKEAEFGWTNNCLITLANSVEVPYFLLAEDIMNYRKPELKELKFHGKRIKANVNRISTNSVTFQLIYDKIKDDVNTHYYASGKLQECSGQKDIIERKIKALAARLDKFEDLDLAIREFKL